MKKIILSLLFTMIATLSANEIEVFSTNTLNIVLDRNTTFKKIYMGKYTDFIKNANSIFNAKNAIFAGISGSLFGATAISQSNVDIKASVGAGALGALAGYAIGSSVKWFISDNEYVYISLAKNSKGESTLIQTLIVANNFLLDSTIEKISIDARQSLLK